MSTTDSLTPETILEGEVMARMNADRPLVKKINAIILFDISGPEGGQWTMDCTLDEGWIQKGRKGRPRLKISMSDETFVKVHTKQLSPHVAGMTGKVQFKPMDFGIANKLLRLLR